MGSRLQQFPAALISRIPDPGSLCRDHRRNRLQRYAIWKLRVSAGCPHRAIWRIRNRRGSNHCRMKVQWQVNVARLNMYNQQHLGPRSGFERAIQALKTGAAEIPNGVSYCARDWEGCSASTLGGSGISTRSRWRRTDTMTSYRLIATASITGLQLRLTLPR